MLSFFRRRAQAAGQPSTTHKAPVREPARPGGSPSGFAPTEPAPIPEVLAEGNEQTDWSLWEDSVNALDSQFQGAMPSSRIYVRQPTASQLGPLEGADAYSSVGKNRDL